MYISSPLLPLVPGNIFIHYATQGATHRLTWRESALLAKGGSGGRPCNTPRKLLKNAWAGTLSFTVLPSVLVENAGNASKLWSSSKECWAAGCNNTRSLKKLPAVRVRKRGMATGLASLRKNDRCACAARYYRSQCCH